LDKHTRAVSAKFYIFRHSFRNFILQVRLSVLKSGTSTWPHCGPTNYILEAHLGLVTHSDARLRVGNETRWI